MQASVGIADQLQKKYWYKVAGFEENCLVELCLSEGVSLENYPDAEWNVKPSSSLGV